ncbi:hypothetical protein RvY_16744 [Ramazzottius varieornatus]|uniref:Uncharacterized protein n=1 Tax=Ramazzottius varieornatus TaxID=947166 RepID=A0A1D1W261_RAMVA|nr:hypothetical protein RvY_16744 [Ramazzottius varieornatus]
MQPTSLERHFGPTSPVQPRSDSPNRSPLSSGRVPATVRLRPKNGKDLLFASMKNALPSQQRSLGCCNVLGETNFGVWYFVMLHIMFCFAQLACFKNRKKFKGRSQ